MKKVVAVLSFAALAGAVACSEAPTAAPAPAGVSFTQDISGPTLVSFVFEMPGGGGTVGFAPGENAHPQVGSPAGGSCRQADGTIDTANPENNTTWYNSAGNKTNAKFCQGSEGEGGELTTCTFDVPATYAAGGTNQNLNFDVSYAVTGSDLFVHFNDNRDRNIGKGTIRFDGAACDDGSTVDVRLALQQYTGGGSSVFLSHEALGVTKPGSGPVQVTVDGTAHDLISVQWTSRSQVGS